MGKWNDDINKGSKAEDMVLMWLGGKAGFDDILAVEEVKNSWHGQEIFIEEDSVIEKKKPGWIYTSKADRFIFVDCQNEKAAVIQTDELRMGYMNLKDKYKLLTQETVKNDGSRWHSSGRFLPLSEFNHAIIEFKVRKT